MKPFLSHDLDRALAHPEAPSFAALIDQLAQAEDLSAERRRDLVSGLRRLARALGRPVEEVPADPRWLQPRITAVAPAAIGLSPKSWTNLISDARAAMAHCGVVTRRNNRREQLSPAWQHLWSLVLASKDLSIQSPLGRFVHVLDRLGVAPEEVDEDHAAAFREALERNAIHRQPEVSWRAGVNAWNRAQARLPEWPRRRLSLPSRRNPIVLPLDTFPASFQADLERYLQGLAHPDPLDPEARLEALRPASIKERRLEVIRVASALVRAGEPVEDLVSLANLVEPARAERALRALLERNGSRKTHVVARAAEMLRQVGQHFVRVDADTQGALDRMARKLAMPQRTGLTPKNRTRLRQIEDPAALRRLLLLPERLVANAEADPSSFQAQLARETAVAIAILLASPIRMSNLSRIALGRNLQRVGSRAFLVFEPEEVKNRQRLEFELPAGVVTLIDRHLARRSPGLCPRGTVWLFPKRDGSAPLDQNHFAKRICETIRRETGIVMNMHLFRHLAAKLYLDAHPGSYEAVRRLLGHAQLSSTLSAYAGHEAGSATKAFAAIIETARRG